MPFLKNAKNLIFGNGDLFLAPAGVAYLPSEAVYKAALLGGTLATLAGSTGAVKGTAEIIIDRKIIDFEVGVPQEVADQTVSVESCIFKCSLAELALSDLQLQLGLPSSNYTTQNSGATLVTNEAHTLFQNVAVPLTWGPVLNTTTSPTASNPVVRNASVTSTIYTAGTDYIIDYTNGLITALSTGSISNNTNILVTYSYNAVSTETLTMGGQNSVLTVALRFFHPYADGRVIYITIPKANPTGAITIPFEEVAYSTRVVEFKAIADFTQPEGNELFSVVRDSPVSAPTTGAPVIL